MSWQYVLDKAIAETSKMTLTLDASCTALEETMAEQINKIINYVDVIARKYGPANEFVTSKFSFVYAVGVEASRYSIKLNHKIHEINEIINVLDD